MAERLMVRSDLEGPVAGAVEKESSFNLNEERPLAKRRDD